MAAPLLDGWLVELLAPRTDAIVAVQGFALLVIFALLWWPARRLDVVPLWWGLFLLSMGLFGLRAVH